MVLELLLDILEMLLDLCPTMDVSYIASTRDETGPGASGQVQDLQGHHQDDQEQLLDHF